MNIILNDVCFSHFVNVKNLKINGLDDPNRCRNKQHFLNYPHEIEYNYNSRGFRDEEWPPEKELKSSIWCVGDSFTVGVGQPYNFIWPQVLQQKLGKRTINVSRDGASNDWIIRQSKKILDTIKPELMIVMFSYLHRREDKNGEQIYIGETDEMKNIEYFEKQFLDFQNYSKNTRMMYFMIPMAFDFEFYTKNCKKNVLGDGTIKKVVYLDKARDFHHFDIKTSEMVCNYIVNRI